MPDITMCLGGTCSIKEECYRYKANPDTMQSYFIEPPIKGLTCDHFMHIENEPDEFINELGVYYDVEKDSIFTIEQHDVFDALVKVHCSEDGNFIGINIPKSDSIVYLGEL